MALPAPNLDDRRFQNLVDDAKRLVQRRCPEWTDHNVSDPGVTLIETFAYMTDQLLYRLNRVPDRNYIKFLELIGVRLFPPTAATTKVTFWLSAPQEIPIVVPVGVEVATPRTEAVGSAIAFTTTDTLDIVPCEMSHVGSIPTGGTWRNHTDTIKLSPFSCFSPQPVPGEVLLIGLSAAVPRCAVSLRFDCTIEGIGVDPEWPPLAWEAYDGESWVECEVDTDTTGGLNRAGEVVLHVPPTHVMSLEHQLRAGWLRARVTTPEEDQPFYSNSPLIHGLDAHTIGGTIEAVQAEVIEEEVIGQSEGVPGSASRWPGRRSSRRASPSSWRSPTRRRAGRSGSRSRTSPKASPTTATSCSMRWPAKCCSVRPCACRTGSSWATGPCRPKEPSSACAATTPAVDARATWPRRRSGCPGRRFRTWPGSRTGYPATGGVDGEDIEEAKIRGPIVMRTLGRAVTAEDYEQLAKEAAPEAARIRAVPAATEEDAGGVRVLVVPAVADDEDGRLSFEQLVPGPGDAHQHRQPSSTPGGRSAPG